MGEETRRHPPRIRVPEDPGVGSTRPSRPPGGPDTPRPTQERPRRQSNFFRDLRLPAESNIKHRPNTTLDPPLSLPSLIRTAVQDEPPKNMGSGKIGGQRTVPTESGGGVLTPSTPRLNGPNRHPCLTRRPCVVPDPGLRHSHPYHSGTPSPGHLRRTTATVSSTLNSLASGKHL